MTERKCQVANCNKEGKFFRMSIDANNSTALNGFLCESHYERLLDVVREVINFQLPDAPTIKPKLENHP